MQLTVEVVSHFDQCFVVTDMPKGLANQKRMEGAVSSGLLETIGGGVHGLSGCGEGTTSEHLNLLGMSNFGTGVDDFLSSLEEFLSEVSKL